MQLKMDIRRKINKSLGLCFLVLFFSSSANATLIPTGVEDVQLDIDDTGTLLGARNVNVNGILYDVVFDGRSYTDIFIDSSGLDATDSKQSVRFSTALMNFVFVDFGNYLFDSRPFNTAGCSDVDICMIMTPYSVSSIAVTFSHAQNGDAEFRDGVAVGGVGPLAPNISKPRPLPPVEVTTSQSVYANWSVSQITTDIPEPSTWLLLIGGILLIARPKRVNKGQIL